ncbi:MAG: sugar transferase, partial [Ruthenibacterium sp.]
MQTMIDMKSMIRAHTIVLSQKQMRYLKIKRMLDLFFSAFALIVLSPLMLLVAIGIKIESPHEPILFVQLRVGKDYKVFKLFKFRSMRSTAPKNAASGELENPEEYITGFGKLIRMTSIDELPQLINILRGDMSIIGPRPLVYTEREIRFLRRYYGLYQVRPGLSGMAQINGRD